ncbi:MAG: inorganic phosphate transporter [Armatimonadota bacterium]
MNRRIATQRAGEEKLGSEALVILGLAVAFGAYMAWNIGANDVANSMGTSVGSRALTVRQAIVAAAVANFLGAVLVGGHVTDTVRKKMIDPGIFADDIHLLAYGMLAALLAAGLWLQFATYLKMPVSTTQSIIGGVVGFALVAAGAKAVAWGKVSQIVLSWLVCPAISGVAAYLLSTLVRTRIINSHDPIGATRRWTPIMVFAVFFTLCLVILFKGLKNLHLDLPWQQAVVASGLVGGLAAVFGWILVGRAQPPPEDQEALALASQERRHAQLLQALDRALAALKGAEVATTGGPSDAKVSEAASVVEALVKEVQASTPAPPLGGERSFRFVERVFASLQVVSACCLAFAHGSNDVANAVGPLAAVANVVQSGTVAGKVAIPMWTLVLGGAFIAFGIATWGQRVMVTVGKRITHLTATRGFSAEFAAAVTVVLASRLGLPVSTTHVIVGAVMGVGLARGIASVDWRVTLKMSSMWVLEVPAVALISGGLFLLLRALF